MQDEPRKHPVFMAVLALVCLATVPLPFIGKQVWLFGVPAWIWWSFGWTTALSCVTVWGILRYWSVPAGDGEDEPD